MNSTLLAKSNGVTLKEHINAVAYCADFFNDKVTNLDKRVFYYFAVLHDIGKVKPEFQEVLNGIKKSAFEDDIKFRHEICSLLFLDVVPEDIRDIVGMTILTHHKSFDDEIILGLTKNVNSKLQTTIDKYYIKDIDTWGKVAVDFLFENFEIRATIPTKERCKEIINHFFDAKNGYISTLSNGISDYKGICMMADYFASAKPYKYKEFLNSRFTVPDTSFYFNKNEKYPLSLIDSDKRKKHTLCTAPCGCGKTNFMLKRCEGRVFYLLPYQASINAMAQRIKNDIHCDVGIRHASLKSLTFIDDNIKTLSRLPGSPITVMTPYQIVSILLCCKGYELTVLDLIGQDVILDEIHTYSGKHLAVVLYLIEVLKYFNCRIHICTATMPSCLKDEILAILGVDNTQIVELTDEEKETFNRHIIHTVSKWQTNDIINRYNNGEKVLVVCNQVETAKEVYREIKSCGQFKSLLIHSCYKRKDRNRIEAQLMSEYNASDEPCIVVSTQVVEVSLDINFDVMFTECANIMSLTQRFGRINRQRSNIGTYKDVFVSRPKMIEHECLPYSRMECQATYRELQKYNERVLDEREIQSVIDAVYPQIQVETYSRLLPFYNDGTWKIKEYQTTSAKPEDLGLEFDGAVLLTESDYNESHDNEENEIPVSVSKLKKISIIPEIEEKEKEKNTKKRLYVIPDHCYDQEFGLILG